MSFLNLNLKKEFAEAIESAGYQSPTKLQTELIPLVAERKNILVWSQSAAGKTGAFLIPAVNYILSNPLDEKRGARILILTSRRDRVSQINYTLKRLTREHNMRFGFIVSGRPYQPQMRLMRRPLDMMIATPGRLNDLVDNNKADFSQLEMLIIDDLTTIYQKNMHGLISKVQQQVQRDCPVIAFLRQDEETEALAREMIPDAIEIVGLDDEEESSDASTSKTQLSLPQKAYIADDQTHKIALMDHFLDELAGESVIIHVASNKDAVALQDAMVNHGHDVGLLKKDESLSEPGAWIVSDQQNTSFKGTTDHQIIQFNLAKKLDDYTGRFDNFPSGYKDAIVLVDGKDRNVFIELEKAMGEPIPQHIAPGLEPVNPFVSTQPNSRGRKSSPRNTSGRKTSNNGRRNTGGKHPANSKQSDKKRGGKTTANITRKRSNRSAGQDNKDNKRQRKGPYGRLNGGAQRKRSDIGVMSDASANGPTPMANREWDQALAENKPSKEKRVVIRYKDKKRVLLKEDPGTDT